VKGLPSLWTWIAPSEISVLPVPHSANTMPVRACRQRLASPMIAIVWAGNGRRNNPSIRGLNGAQFRSAPPPILHSARYARDFNEVKLVGDVNSDVRPQDRTDVAHFYLIAAVQVYNPAARQVSFAQNKTLSQNAHDFALLAMAVCDGLISSMETKYYYNRWRPVTAIRAADTDGNPNTDPDPAWLPLITTPPFPSSPSAHASAGGAARRILERVYGKDGFLVTLTSPTAPNVTLHYTACCKRAGLG
jgi:hypothetical protein